MKKLLVATLVVLSTQVACADVGGIYLSPDDPALVVTVHQNGNTLVVLQHNPVAAYSTIDLGDGQAAVPTLLNSLSYYVGQLSADAKSSTVIGLAAAGTCGGVYQIQFSANALSMSLKGLQQTTAGTNQGIDCATLSTKLKSAEQGGAPTLVRIF
ncbi:MAG: hypothetical protein KGZ83_20960 [Sulfuricella sp.]|nr:hypothetical protein [Sulfuricella sp.]